MTDLIEQDESQCEDLQPNRDLIGYEFPDSLRGGMFIVTGNWHLVPGYVVIQKTDDPHDEQIRPANVVRRAKQLDGA